MEKRTDVHSIRENGNKRCQVEEVNHGVGEATGLRCSWGAVLTPRGSAGRAGLMKGGGHPGLLTSRLAPDPARLQGWGEWAGAGVQEEMRDPRCRHTSPHISKARGAVSCESGGAWPPRW